MNTTANRIARLVERARALTADRLIVLFRTPDGEEAEGGVDEMIAANGAFIEVIDGNSLTDLDAILEQFKIEADNYFFVRKER